MSSVSSLLPPAEQRPAELRDLLNSKLFERSSTLCSLLFYLWEHRLEDISEYAIAIDALGRKPDFDPKNDSTVRVHISRLRKRLSEFYENEGSHLRTRIEIPMGTHTIRTVEVEPTIRRDAVDSTPSDPKRIAVVQKLLLRREVFIYFGLMLALLAGGGGIIFWRHAFAKQNAKAPSEQSQLSAFWRAELNNGKPTRIAVSSPAFFLWNNTSTDQLVARDSEVNDFSQLKDSARLASLKREYGQPQLNQAFILATDAFGLIRLIRYFDSYGIQMPVYSTSDSPATRLDHENLIVLGNYRNLAAYHPYMDRMTFKMDPQQVAVIDKNPLPGRPHRFDSVRESPTRAISPGVIAVLPGSNVGTRIIIIMASFDTSSLTTYLTSQHGLSELENARMKQGGSPFFEAVILTEMNGEVRLKSWLAEMKPYPPTDGLHDANPRLSP